MERPEQALGEWVYKADNKATENVRDMKETLNLEKPMGNEFYDFHEKVNAIIDEQEDVYATHMHSIKADSKLLEEETRFMYKIQG